MQLTKLATFTIKCYQNELILFVLGEECYEKFVTSLSWGKSCSGLNNEQDKAKKFQFDEMEHLAWFYWNDKPGMFALQNVFDICNVYLGPGGQPCCQVERQ